MTVARGRWPANVALAVLSTVVVLGGAELAVRRLGDGPSLRWIMSRQTGFLVLGLLVLGEELYETGLVAFVIRLGEAEAGVDQDHSRATPPSPSSARPHRANRLHSSL